MARTPTTMIQPGAGGPILNDFCECVCGILTPVLYVTGRSATAGYLYDYSDPVGANIFTLAQTRLAAAAYSTYEAWNPSPGRDFGGSLASVQTSWSTDNTVNSPSSAIPPFTATETIVNSISTDTDGSRPFFSASLKEAKYKLRVSFPGPWRGSGTIAISWRERTVNYSLLQTSTKATTYPAEGGAVYSPTTYVNAESGAIAYQDRSETLTPAAGALYAETAEYELPASGLNVGDAVSITGPAAIGTFFTRGGAQDQSCGINVTAFAATGNKIGFLPYLRARAAAGNAEAEEPADIFATETASVAAGFTQSYSGAQTVLAANRIASDRGYSYPQNTFSADVPGTVQSRLDGNGNPPSTVGAVSVTPTVVQWASPAGLVMTLSDPIPTSALTAFVNALVAAAPSPMNPDSSGVLALRHLPPDELCYAVKQATQQGFLSIAVDSGIFSQAGTSAAAPVLALASGSVTVTVDLLTTNLDTGAQADSQLSFTFALASTASGIQTLALTQDTVDVPIPATNQLITWSNPQVTTTSLDCWCASPQAVVVDASV